jgi:hypothetical protein
VAFGLAGNAISAEEIDRAEQIGFHVLTQLFERRSIQRRAAISVVDVFLDQHMARRGDLPFQFNNLLSIVPSFCCASELIRGKDCPGRWNGTPVWFATPGIVLHTN